MAGGMSRAEHSARNAAVAVAAKVIAILAGYATRIVFTHTLSEAYVGVNGLFTDILNVLALSELGIGTAIAYALYRPVHEGDTEKQRSLMRLYRNLYRGVAAAVLAAGLCVAPFLDRLVDAPGQIEGLTAIYLMYLANSALSYLFAYKKALVDAHQLGYIGVMYQTGFLILQDVLQAAVLLLTGDFILFVSVSVLCTLGNNIAISRKADRMYPYMAGKGAQALPKAEKQAIWCNIRAMLVHKAGSVAVNNTDNLLLSAITGIASVGAYSNYFLVLGSVRQVIGQAFQGIIASVGDLAAGGDSLRMRRVFEASCFLGHWLFGTAAICLYQLVDSVVGSSFGAQYVFPKHVTLVLCINFYLNGIRQAGLVFRDSMGLFYYDRYKAPVEAAINLAVSVFLGQRIGVAGIFLGTAASRIATSLWVEPYVLYRHRLKAPVSGFFLRNACYTAVTALLWALEGWLCSFFPGEGIVCGVLRADACLAVTSAAYLALYHRTDEFQTLMQVAEDIISKRRKAA